ncbi:MAG: cysteine methyltransferase [Micrococcales bacterium]|nr:MAG: cysteine methyltransferase [Micrococcales bacterium]
MDAEQFSEEVLALVDRIPPGQVCTYGLIAGAVGAGGPRQVGSVVRRDGAAVPWWRVVRADGSLPAAQAARAVPHYIDEGTPRRHDGRVDMRRALWPAP